MRAVRSYELLCEFLQSHLFPDTDRVVHVGPSIGQLANPYMDVYNGPRSLWEFIKNSSETTRYFEASISAPPRTYMSSYAAICQRSGSGKTRGMLELGKKHCPLVYICMDGAEFKSPPNILQFLDSLRAGHSTCDDQELKACLFIQEVASFILAEAKKFGDDHSALLKHLVDIFKPTSDTDARARCEAIWKTILDEVETPRSSDQLAKHTKNYDKVLIQLEELGITKFVIAFDEARKLLNEVAIDYVEYSSFRILRRAFSYTNNGKEVPFMLLADTNSRVCNFIPTLKLDPSGRKPKYIGDLHPAFIYFTNIDLYASLEYFPELEKYLSAEDADWNGFVDWREDDPLVLATLGSALWKTSILSNPATSMGKLIGYATWKLSGGPSAITRPDDFNYLAALACRFNIKVMPNTSLAVDMVAYNMAQLVYVTRDRATGYIAYPSDPILAEGGARLLASKALEAMTQFRDKLRLSVLDSGDLGELAVEFLLGSAIDLACPRSGTEKCYFSSVHFCALLKALLNTNTGGKGPEGRVAFNHFISFTDRIASADLGHLLSRCAAASCSPCQPGFDVVIPLILEDGRLSAVFIQTKNYSEPISPRALECIDRRMKVYATEVLDKSLFKKLAPLHALFGSFDTAALEAFVAASLLPADPAETKPKTKRPKLDKLSPEDAQKYLDQLKDIEQLGAVYMTINLLQGQKDIGAASIQILGDTITVQGSVEEAFRPLWGSEDALAVLAEVLRMKEPAEELRQRSEPAVLCKLAKDSRLVSSRAKYWRTFPESD